MRGIYIATKYHRLAPFTQLLAFSQERIIKGQFEGYAFMVATAVGKIAINQRKGRILSNDRAAFLIKFFQPQPMLTAP